jgi:hypothetical protein
MCCGAPPPRRRARIENASERYGAGGEVRGGEKAYNRGIVSTPTQYPSHAAFPQPDDPKVRVWRYIDFPKFVAWLINGTLILRRVNLLDDKREGHHGRFFFHLAFVTAFRQMEAAKEPPTHAERERAATEKAHEALRDVERNRLASFVSCWRGGDTESEAMWRIYAGGGASVALVLPYERLRDSLPKDSVSTSVRSPISISIREWCRPAMYTARR